MFEIDLDLKYFFSLHIIFTKYNLKNKFKVLLSQL